MLSDFPVFSLQPSDYLSQLTPEREPAKEDIKSNQAKISFPRDASTCKIIFQLRLLTNNYIVFNIIKYQIL